VHSMLLTCFCTAEMKASAFSDAVSSALRRSILFVPAQTFKLSNPDAMQNWELEPLLKSAGSLVQVPERGGSGQGERDRCGDGA